MKRTAIALLLAALTSAGLSAQTDNTLYARAFPGATAGAKIAAAQGACNPSTLVPCIIVIDPSLAPGVFAAGTDPAPCSHCYWLDYRQGLPWQSQVNGLCEKSGFQDLKACWGAKGDGQIHDGVQLLADGSCSASSNVWSSASSTFTSLDVGKDFYSTLTGLTSINSLSGAAPYHSIVLGASCGSGGGSQTFTYGTDDTVPLSNCINSQVYQCQGTAGVYLAQSDVLSISGTIAQSIKATAGAPTYGGQGVQIAALTPGINLLEIKSGGGKTIEDIELNANNLALYPLWIKDNTFRVDLNRVTFVNPATGGCGLFLKPANGHNYLSSSAASVTGGSGSSATLNVVASQGQLLSATVASGGSAYMVGDTLTVVQSGAYGGLFYVSTISGAGGTGPVTSVTPVDQRNSQIDYITARKPDFQGGPGTGTCQVKLQNSQTTQFLLDTPSFEPTVGMTKQISIENGSVQINDPVFAGLYSPTGSIDVDNISGWVSISHGHSENKDTFMHVGSLAIGFDIEDFAPSQGATCTGSTICTSLLIDNDWGNHSQNQQGILRGGVWDNVIDNSTISAQIVTEDHILRSAGAADSGAGAQYIKHAVDTGMLSQSACATAVTILAPCVVYAGPIVTESAVMNTTATVFTASAAGYYEVSGGMYATVGGSVGATVSQTATAIQVGSTYSGEVGISSLLLGGTPTMSQWSGLAYNPAVFNLASGATIGTRSIQLAGGTITGSTWSRFVVIKRLK